MFPRSDFSLDVTRPSTKVGVFNRFAAALECKSVGSVSINFNLFLGLLAMHCLMIVDKAACFSSSFDDIHNFRLLFKAA